MLAKHVEPLLVHALTEVVTLLLLLHALAVDVELLLILLRVNRRAEEVEELLVLLSVDLLLLVHRLLEEQESFLDCLLRLTILVKGGLDVREEWSVSAAHDHVGVDGVVPGIGLRPENGLGLGDLRLDNLLGKLRLSSSLGLSNSRGLRSSLGLVDASIKVKRDTKTEAVVNVARRLGRGINHLSVRNLSNRLGDGIGSRLSDLSRLGDLGLGLGGDERSIGKDQLNAGLNSGNIRLVGTSLLCLGAIFGIGLALVVGSGLGGSGLGGSGLGGSDLGGRGLVSDLCLFGDLRLLDSLWLSLLGDGDDVVLVVGNHVAGGRRSRGCDGISARWDNVLLGILVSHEKTRNDKTALLFHLWEDIHDRSACIKSVAEADILRKLNMEAADRTRLLEALGGHVEDLVLGMHGTEQVCLMSDGTDEFLRGLGTFIVGRRSHELGINVVSRDRVLASLRGTLRLVGSVALVFTGRDSNIVVARLAVEVAILRRLALALDGDGRLLTTLLLGHDDLRRNLGDGPSGSGSNLGDGGNKLRSRNLFKIRRVGKSRIIVKERSIVSGRSVGDRTIGGRSIVD